MKSAVLIVSFAFLSAAPALASVKAPAQVTATKGPIQITLRLQKTTVKVDRTLWYTLELKNIGKKKLQVFDKIFKDPYAMHVNSNHRHGLYLEIIDANGKAVRVKWGSYRVKYDWEPEGDAYYKYTPEEKKEIKELRAGWKKDGMTDQQLSVATSRWGSEFINKKNYAEDSDPAKQFWLMPGASTATFAWSDRGPGDYPGRSEDDESLRQGYTELWSHPLYRPGKYRVRAVYDHAYTKTTQKSFKKRGIAPDPAAIEFKTPFIAIEVLP